MHPTIFSNLSQVDVLFIIISLFLLYILLKNLKSLFFPNKSEKDEVLQNRLSNEKIRIEKEANELKRVNGLEKTNNKLIKNLYSKILEFKSLATDKERFHFLIKIPSWQIEDFTNEVKKINLAFYVKFIWYFDHFSTSLYGTLRKGPTVLIHRDSNEIIVRTNNGTYISFDGGCNFAHN